MQCYLCGFETDDATECEECSNYTCLDHYVETSGLCLRCHRAKILSKAREYYQIAVDALPAIPGQIDQKQTEALIVLFQCVHMIEQEVFLLARLQGLPGYNETTKPSALDGG
jgi:hypothetical protein